MTFRPENWWNWSSLAFIQGRLEKSEDALMSAQRGLELNPEEPSLFYNACCYALRIGRKKAAMKYLRKAISIDPSYKMKAREDPDLRDLREDPDFEEVFKVLST